MIKNKLKLLSAVALICLSHVTEAQQVSTVVGTQSPGLITDDNWTDNSTITPPTSAKINFPYGVAIDAYGRIIFTDFYNNKIRIVVGSNVYNRSGNLGGMSNSFGYQDGASIGLGGGWLFGPAGICVSPTSDSSIYIADNMNHAIRKFTKFVNAGNSQFLTTIAGDISEINTKNGEGYPGIDDGPALDGPRFTNPTDVAVDANGTIYVADRGNHVIKKISGGVVTTIAGSIGNSGYANGTATAAKFNLPMGLYLENNNSLIIADYGNSCIRRLNLTTMEVTLVAGVPETTGGDDGSVMTAKFENPSDVTGYGNFIFVSDHRANTIRMINNGVVTTIAGAWGTDGYNDGNDTSARFSSPRSLTYSASDKALYVTEEGNNVIRRVKLTPTVAFTAAPTTVKTNVNVVITNQSTDGTYKWTITPSTYSIVSGSLTSRDLTVKFSAEGNYTVKLVVTSSLGMDSIIKTNHIVVDNTNGIKGVKFTEQVNAYPNPSNGVFTIEGAREFSNAKIIIVNAVGQIVQEEILNGSKAVVNLSNQPSGVYFVNINNNGVQSYTRLQVVR